MASPLSLHKCDYFNRVTSRLYCSSAWIYFHSCLWEFTISPVQRRLTCRQPHSPLKGHCQVFSYWFCAWISTYSYCLKCSFKQEYVFFLSGLGFGFFFCFIFSFCSFHGAVRYCESVLLKNTCLRSVSSQLLAQFWEQYILVNSCSLCCLPSWLCSSRTKIRVQSCTKSSYLLLRKKSWQAVVDLEEEKIIWNLEGMTSL